MEQVDAEIRDRQAVEVLAAIGDGDDGNLVRVGRGDGVASLFRAEGRHVSEVEKGRRSRRTKSGRL
jgi:hypothetical protein